MKTVTTSVGFQDPLGNLVLSGNLVLTLSQAAEVTSGGGLIAPKVVVLPLNAVTAKIASTQIWFNDELTPTGTTYHAELLDSGGNIIADFGQWSITGASADLSTMVPVTSATVSLPGVVLTAPAADQHITGTFNLTTPKFNSVIWVDGTQYTTIAAAYAALPSTGGCVMVPPNYSETVAASWTLGTKYSAIIFTGPAHLSFGTNTITVSVATHNVRIASLIPMGSSTNTGGVYFSYTGSGTFVTVGASSADTLAFECSNISFDSASAGSAAVVMKLARVQDYLLDRLHMNGAGAATTQQGIILDGTGNFTGGNIYYPKLTGYLKSIQGTGSGAAAANANTIIGGSISSPPSGTSLGIDLQAGCAGNTILGIDVEQMAVGYNLAGTSTGNCIIARSESNTSGCTIGASSTQNEVHLLDTVDPITDSGTGNLKFTAGNIITGATLKSATLTEASNTNTVTLLNLQDVVGPLTGNSGDQTVFTYTLPANTIAAGKGIRVSCAVLHGTGTASVTYKVFFGSTVANSGASTAGSIFGETIIMNRPGVTNAQRTTGYILAAGASVVAVTTGNAPAEDTTTNIVVKLTFNVANTDQVTGGQFVVELIQ